ncbi:MAG: hypothetical protein Greene101449_933 [Candidatus Peregrinibacteria bacterium Greene1014_49]|nr:MAG: hypothetical protein Greene101449_933 [Candidatus Peregrinibacteria bacterium Greene1014_49]
MQLYSYLSQKCKAKKSAINGWGVFARDTINKGELVAAWGGKICHKKEMKRLCKKRPAYASHPISVFDDLFLVPLDVNLIEDSDKFNHSCNPNTGVRGQILLIARKQIPVGEEICFDYETTQMGNFDGLPFLCKCNSKNCRKRITGKAWKNKEFRKKNHGFFSWYIEKKLK